VNTRKKLEHVICKRKKERDGASEESPGDIERDALTIRNDTIENNGRKLRHAKTHYAKSQ
jgi:hypothetical protein